MVRSYPDGVLERLQAMELEMLEAIDRICRENGITYFADAGTCLGAVRHGGFIPWDDDIDIGMPIDDYRRFCRLAPVQLPEGMSLHTMEDTPGFSPLWAKVYRDGTRFVDEGALASGCEQGVFVDVFPYVPLDGPAAQAARQLLRTQRWQKVSYLRHMGAAAVPVGASLRAPKALACALAKVVLSVAVSDDAVRARFERAIPQESSGAIWANPCATRPYPFAREVLFEPAEADFCGLPILMPHDADAYLTQLYGDYLRVPAPEERHTHTPVTLDFGDGVNVMAAGG